MIQAQNLRKAFGDIVAVDDISFTLEKGQTFGLLGPNGAGKSTTINMLVGALTPDDGTITVGDETDPTAARVRRKIGAAPQALALYDELTAEENLIFFARLYGYSGSSLSSRVNSALEIAALQERRGHRVKTFSGGMKRRLNLAAALVHDPPILMLDEPTVGVDPQSRNMIFERIEELRAAGRTIVYTTHYMEEAERLCDRVAIIDNGRILDLDTVDSLIDRHGGASVVEAELTEKPSDSSSLPGELHDLTLRVETDRPFEIISELSDKGVRFRTLRIERPDLESVFLNLTGRSLCD
ncbi:MAG: ABC transporter ATP-binding protein [Candidatus Zixiibacteriota bacterium]